jgi:hypothetical protein
MGSSELIEAIASLPRDWHGEGTATRSVLVAIARHAGRIGGVEDTVETGSGKTTLLFSHISGRHTSFAVDEGRSISQVRGSDLFNSATVTYIEGPSQRTLPKHTFKHMHQIALIDGPHGYPFPDLEYYYLYPTIQKGGVLILDDIKIPSVGRMFEIIKAEKMFSLLEIVDDNTAIFERTDAPLIDPESDSWWLQGFNRPYFEQKNSPPKKRYPQVASFLNGLSNATPELLKKCLPQRFKEMMWRRM